MRTSIRGSAFALGALLILAAMPGIAAADTFTVSIVDLEGKFVAESEIPGLARGQVMLEVFQVSAGPDVSIFEPALVSTAAALSIIVSDAPVAAPPLGAIVIVQPNVKAVRLRFSSGGLRTATVDLANRNHTIQVPMPLDQGACCQPAPSYGHGHRFRFWRR